jgi:copper chaperone CopZ
MKPLIIILSVFLLLTLPLEAKKKKKNIETTSYSVNIDCKEHCVDVITKELAFVKGVRDLDFNIEKKRVDVTYRSDKVSKEVIAKKIRDLGYEVSIREEEKEKEEEKG